MFLPPLSSRGQVSDSDRECIVRRLTPLLAGHGVLRLFGLRARGNAGDRSAIDLAVMSVDGLATDLLAQIREAVEEAPIPFRADNVDYRSASLQLQRAIDLEGLNWMA